MQRGVRLTLGQGNDVFNLEWLETKGNSKGCVHAAVNKVMARKDRRKTRLRPAGVVARSALSGQSSVRGDASFPAIMLSVLEGQGEIVEIEPVVGSPLAIVLEARRITLNHVSKRGLPIAPG
jgi:hypothetical protein